MKKCKNNEKKSGVYVHEFLLVSPEPTVIWLKKHDGT